MYANQDADFYRAYAEAIADDKPEAEMDALAQALDDAFNSVYRLVAFDVDGTLTPTASPEVDADAARLIVSLLERGVEVLLVTGRGRTATRDAAKQILQLERVPARVLQRLSAITNNGLWLLESGPDGPLLERELQLDAGFSLGPVTAGVVEQLDGLGITPVVHPHRVGTSEDGALRVELPSEDAQVQALEHLALRFKDDGINVTSGRYGNVFTLDLTSTDKRAAIDYVAARRGIDSTMILRLGDRGSEGENDWAMLDSPAGFSVGSCSESPKGCWPVLDQSFQRVTELSGTTALLDGVLMFAPLSVAPKDPQQVLDDLLLVEKAAQRRSRVLRADLTARLRMRARSFASEVELPGSQWSLLEVSDLYDPWSGAVRLRDWERPDVSDEFADLFDLPLHEVPPPSTEPVATWAMWCDGGLLLRGPSYYVGLLRKDATFDELRSTHSVFLTAAGAALNESAHREFTLLEWKLVLGVIDQTRNLGLAALLAAFYADAPSDAERVQMWLVELAALHATLLVGIDETWSEVVDQVCQATSALLELVGGLAPSVGEQSLYAHRECDFFLENLLAAESAVRGLRESGQWKRSIDALAIGLANGGAELPSVLSAVARRTGAVVGGGLLRLSTYGEAKLGRHGSQIREGDAKYVRELRNDLGRYMEFGDAGTAGARVVILCDDNMTTGTSLQHARDVILLRGDQVTGAAVVRYPSANRAVHMNLPGHGFPAPAALSSFVRGLVSPAPYTRLVVPGDSDADRYRNRYGTFNKAKDRLERLIGKRASTVRPQGTESADDVAVPEEQTDPSATDMDAGQSQEEGSR